MKTAKTRLRAEVTLMAIAVEENKLYETDQS